MFRLTRAQVQPIGVDLGHDAVKMLQVEVVGGDQLRVVAAAREEVPHDVRRDPRGRAAAAADVVRRLLRTGGFHGRRVVAALPREALHVKNLRMPVIPAAELDAAVQFEARNVFPFDIDRAQVRCLPAGEVRQGNDHRQEVILLAARDADIEAHVELLHRTGAQVDSLDPEPCALYRVVERFIRRKEDEQDVHVLVEVGWRRAHVVIGRGRDVVFYKPIDVGGRHLTDAVARKLTIAATEAQGLRRRLAETPVPPGEGDPGRGFRDPVRQAVYDGVRATIEELAREISLCLRYYSVTFRGSRPTRLRLVGGEGCDPVLQAALSATLPL
ncbi:MAG TPA: pilus assembly protein PilM, partial [Tepidisphaeraceae bacterium]|nr:pilus assembly protein PilM [Tepidisphaeraceae bacterium]